MRLFKLLSTCVVACLLWSSGPAQMIAYGQSDNVAPTAGAPDTMDQDSTIRQAPDGAYTQSYTVEECGRIDEPALQLELEALMAGVLASESELFDIASIVDRQWLALDVSAVLAEEVDAAIAQVRSETVYWERMLSGWSPAKAEEMANQVATTALSSPKLQEKLGELASAVASELAREVEALSAQSASTGLLCLQAYIGAQFSQELYGLFEESFHAEASDVELVTEDIVSVSPLEVHGKTIGGVGAILVATITRRLAQSLGQKLAGRLAGRITGRLLGRLGSSVVPLVGWVIGAGLIVWDLVEGNDGALPQIREALTGAEVQATIRQEIAGIVSDELSAELQSTATLLATSMVEEWLRFCEDYATICGLAATSQDVNGVLAQTRVEELPTLSVWLEALVEIGGSAEVERVARQGILEDLLALPEAAVAILLFARRPETVLAWSELAGAQLVQVVEQGLYKLVTPAELSPALFAKFVTIGNNEVLEKLLVLDSSDLAVLLLLPIAQLEIIAADASISDLTWLSEYLAQVGAVEAGHVASRLAEGSLSLVTLREQGLAQASSQASAAAENRTVTTVEQTERSAEPSEQRLFNAEETIFSSPVVVASIFLLIVLIGWGAMVAIWRTRRPI